MRRENAYLVSRDLSLGLLSSSVRCSLAVANVLLEVSEEPAHRSLVIVMLLALKDDLLEPEDELIAPLFREVLLSEESLATIPLVSSSILVLLRNTILYFTSERRSSERRERNGP